MSSGLIVAVIFLVMSIGLLMYIIKSDSFEKKIKRFIIASTAVYVSGTLLITILALAVSGMNLMIVTIMELVVLFVYVFDTYIIKRISTNMDDLQDAAIEAKKKEENEEKA